MASERNERPKGKKMKNKKKCILIKHTESHQSGIGSKDALAATASTLSQPHSSHQLRLKI
jgi:hypothetical protein